MATVAPTHPSETMYPIDHRQRDRWILDQRPARSVVDPWRPNAFLIENELAANGELAEVTTIFLTGRECPWRCLMCDLWKHTTEERTPVGAIPAQIDFALNELGRSRREEALKFPRTKTAGESVPSGQPGLAADSDGPFPLTTALSPREREQARQRVEFPNASITSSVAECSPPLLGERAGVRGNGAREHAEETINLLGRTAYLRHLKLYNSGSFFDRAAVPVEDYEPIVRRAAGFERVIVESHPALIGDLALRFRDMLAGIATTGTGHLLSPSLSSVPNGGEGVRRTGEEAHATVINTAPQLEVAMGLETAHPGVLEKLNKRVTLEQFANAAAFLKREGIALRVFVLVKPPFMNESEALEWAVTSARFAFDCGAEVVSLIPTRFGNGALEALAAEGQFAPPRLATLESALEQGIALRRGRVFADTWDLEKFSSCPACSAARRERMNRINLEQTLLPPIHCEHCP